MAGKAFSSVAALAAIVCAAPAFAQDAKNYDDLYTKYLTAARSLPAPKAAWMTDLVVDPNARRPNDLVTIRVEESLSATGSADSTVNAGESDSGAGPAAQCPSASSGRRFGQ